MSWARARRLSLVTHTAVAISVTAMASGILGCKLTMPMLVMTLCLLGLAVAALVGGTLVAVAIMLPRTVVVRILPCSCALSSMPPSRAAVVDCGSGGRVPPRSAARVLFLACRHTTSSMPPPKGAVVVGGVEALWIGGVARRSPCCVGCLTLVILVSTLPAPATAVTPRTVMGAVQLIVSTSLVESYGNVTIAAASSAGRAVAHGAIPSSLATGALIIAAIVLSRLAVERLLPCSYTPSSRPPSRAAVVDGGSGGEGPPRSLALVVFLACRCTTSSRLPARGAVVAGGFGAQ